MDHDPRFKELLTTFFIEFLDLFFPQVLAYLDRSSIEFLDKEVFTDVTAGERHEVDLVVKASFKGQDAHFLVHVKTQSSPEPNFPMRMFIYFSRLYAKYRLPVYPIALFSYDKPLQPEAQTHQVAFPDKAVLTFNYTAIQLNRLDWRKFARTPNPVAVALMAKMAIRPEDRPRVKLECLRLLATLKLNPAKMHLIRGFVDSYLRLNRREQVAMQEEMKTMEPTEKEAVTEVLNEWEEIGMERGMLQGVEKTVLRLLQRRFSTIPHEMEERIHSLTLARLDEFAGELLDFHTLADAQAWLTSHA